MTLALAMVGLSVVGVVGMVVDPRTITGLAAWDKPTKFAISIAPYAVAWAWPADQIRPRRGRRLRLVVIGTVGYAAVVGLMTWQALRGQSIVAPDAVTLLGLAAIVVVALGAAVQVLRSHRVPAAA